MDNNRSKRFDFLLKQTEIFSHFMPGSNKITPEKKKSGRKPKEPEEKKQAAPTESPTVAQTEALTEGGILDPAE